MIRILLRRFVLLLALLLLTATTSSSAEIGGVSFAERVPVAESEVVLTGTALLKWAVFFDVYVGAFYLPDRQPGSRWTENVPKHLELFYFRKFKAEDFSSSSDKLLRQTLTPEQYRQLSKRLSDFYRLFRDIEPGDRYSLSYHPAVGTELRLNDELLGAVPGHDFAVAYFGIWLGPKPINKAFRNRLLGG